MAKYGLVGKMFSSGELIGYFLVDELGKKMLISKDKTIRLASNGSIINWSTITDEDGEKHLVGENITLSNVPTMIKDDIEQLELKTRVIKDGETFGFIGIDNLGNKRKYTVNKIWELAKLGKVKGIRAYIHNSDRALLSENQALRNLDSIEMQ